MQQEKPRKFAKPKVATSLFGDDKEELVVQVKLYELKPFLNHPFKVLEDDSLTELLESIKDHGVSNPIIIRPKGQGEFEIIAGHRRAKACELLGLETIPAMIRDLDDEEAVFQMVDTNIQRETLLPSEKAFAYKMKLEAIKRKAGRPEKNVVPVGLNLEKNKSSAEVIADDSGESQNQVKRYIRLTYLLPDFLDLVDGRKLPFQTAVELSYLTPEEQENVQETMEQRALTPTLEQATAMKKCSKEGNLSLTVIESLLVPVDLKPKRVAFKIDRNKYFPKEKPKAEIEELITKLLDNWYENQQQGETEL